MADDSPHDRKLPPEILEHYAAVNEAGRLATDSGPIEYERTKQIVERYLPPPPAIVLDVGGATGVYSCWLAAKGYETHLVDPVAKHVEEAERASSLLEPRLASARLGEARALPWPDGFADVVLLLGPLYHITERSGRIAALRESARVLRSGGWLFAAAISRFASLLDGLRREMLSRPEFADMVERDLADGQHRNETGRPEYFTTAYFHRPEELIAELSDASLRHEATFGLEGPAWLLADIDARCSDAVRRAELLGAVERIEREPSLLGASAHFLAVARKP